MAWHVKPTTLNAAFRFLERLAFPDRRGPERGLFHVFRGHSDSRWKIESTIRRAALDYHLYGDTIDELIEGFRSELALVGKIPFHHGDRDVWLEYARHEGLPSPLIDLTYSPYIALYFALRGASSAQIQELTASRRRLRIIAINVRELAIGYAAWRKEDARDFHDLLDSVMYAADKRRPVFREGYPSNSLIFLPSCSVFNQRMRRQLGAFLYETIHFKEDGVASFDDWVELLHRKRIERGFHDLQKDHPLVYVDIPWSWAGDILERLELMGISGSSLMMDSSGAIADLRTGSRYARRYPTPWDARFTYEGASQTVWSS